MDALTQLALCVTLMMLGGRQVEMNASCNDFKGSLGFQDLSNRDSSREVVVGTNATVILNCSVKGYNDKYNASYHPNDIRFNFEVIQPFSNDTTVIGDIKQLKLHYFVDDTHYNNHWDYVVCNLYDCCLAIWNLEAIMPPAVPANLSCIYWGDVTCTWNADYSGRAGSFTPMLTWSISDYDQGTTNLTKNDSDRWSAKFSVPWGKTGLKRRVNVKVTHIFKSASRSLELYTNSLLDIAQPPVMKGTFMMDDANSSVTISWEPCALFDYDYDFDYTFSYTNHRTQQTYSKYAASTNVILKFGGDGLQYFTNYTFGISCKLTKSGSWSKPYEEVLEMKPGVPAANPQILSGLSVASELIPNNATLRYVTIFWKPIEEELRNSANVQYQVNSNEKISGVTNDIFYRTGPVPADQEMSFEVQTKNVIGYSRDPPSIIRIPAQNKFLSDQLLVEVIRPNSEQANIATIKWTTFDWNVTESVVFWCKKKTNKRDCSDELDWIVLKGPSFKSHLIPMDPKDYSIGVALTTVAGITGIQWSDCIYNAAKAPGAPNDLFLKVVDKSAIQVTWKRPICSTQEQGSIEYYRLESCIGTAEDTCEADTVRYVNISREITSYMTERLEGKKYCFRVASVSSSNHNAWTVLPVCLHMANGPFPIWAIFLLVILGLFAMVGFGFCIRIGMTKWGKFISMNIPMPEDVLKDENVPFRSYERENNYTDIAMKQQQQLMHNRISNGGDIPLNILRSNGSSAPSGYSRATQIMPGHLQHGEFSVDESNRESYEESSQQTPNSPISQSDVAIAMPTVVDEPQPAKKLLTLNSLSGMHAASISGVKRETPAAELTNNKPDRELPRSLPETYEPDVIVAGPATRRISPSYQPLSDFANLASLTGNRQT